SSVMGVAPVRGNGAAAARAAGAPRPGARRRVEAVTAAAPTARAGVVGVVGAGPRPTRAAARAAAAPGAGPAAARAGAAAAGGRGVGRRRDGTVRPEAGRSAAWKGPPAATASALPTRSRTVRFALLRKETSKPEPPFSTRQ